MANEIDYKSYFADSEQKETEKAGKKGEAE